MLRSRSKTHGLSGRAGLDETVGLLRRYVLQETLDPLKGLLRAFAYSLLGAALVGIGAILALLGLLRLLQQQAGGVFSGNWTFAPYLVTALAGILAVAIVFRGLRRSGSDVVVAGNEEAT